MRFDKPLLAIIVAMLIGGVGNTLLATNPQDPYLFLSIRYLIATLILIYWVPKIFKLNWKLQLAGALEVGALITLVLSLSTISVALATTIGTLAPLLSLGINKITQHQNLPKLTILPILLGITATVLIATQKPITVESITGILLAIASIILGTAGSIINGWYGSNTSAWTRAAIPNLFGTIILAPILIINLTDNNAIHPDGKMILAAFLIALLPGTIAKALTLYALKSIPVPLVMEASTLAVITATITSWLLLGQEITLTTIIGVSIGIVSTIILAILIGKQTQPIES